ncbi:MAG: ROK family protein [Polyangiaceae bacterium]|nr:ROK family protein [Polyangiaceae bacterium]
MHIGIDLGGTKIELRALELAAGTGPHAPGRELWRQRVPTPRADAEAIVAAVAELVRRAEHEVGPAASVGIGIPGSPSPRTGLVRDANTTALNGRPLGQMLARALGRSVHLENDANCFALSEASDGAGADAAVVFGVILGTGVGGGLVVRGELWRGRNGIAGEWGHNPLPWPEPEDGPAPSCYCGKSGCIETYLSGPGLVRDYVAQAGREHAPSPGAPADAEAVATRARAGDAVAEACLVRYERRLARALLGVLHVLDPDVVVLGGGLSKLARLYERVPGLWQAQAFADGVTTPLRPAAHGDASGVRGAAWLGRAPVRGTVP